MIDTREIKDWVAPGPERRAEPRRPFACTAYLKLPTQQVIEVHAVDLSTGGIGFVSAINPQPGWVCDISFRVTVPPAGVDQVVARGRIAYSVLSGRQRGFMAGLQFIDLAPECRDSIQRHFKNGGLELGQPA
jgi:hypothetical protein